MTVEEIIQSLARRGCPDLSSSVDLSACGEFPYAGGGYCDVYRGALHNGTSIAIKKLRNYDGPEAEQDSNSRKILKRAARELYHWSKLQHRNVLPLMGLTIFRGQLSMISKWMENGSLEAFLRLTPNANRPTICADVCEGLYYLHANGVVHGDLKATNVMVSSNGTAMIAGFGSTWLKDLSLGFSDTAKISFSVRWAAPELLLEDSGPSVSKEADVYAYGMTVLEVLTGKVPYEGISSDHRVFIFVALQNKIPPRPEANMPDDLWDLLKSCWSRKPSERPNIAGVRDCLQALSWFPSSIQWANGGTTVVEIVHSLTKRGCLDLTSVISMSACSEFPCAGGGNCDVYRGALHDGTRIAIRTLRIYDGPEAERDGNRRKILKRAARELYHWSKLRHCNVLPLMGLAVFRGQISMISKWMENGSLEAFLRFKPNANRPTICADVCEGLCYLHANGAVHGDLKAANVMISSNGTAIIADFGNSQLKNLTLRFSATAKTGLSVRWAAPELLLDDSGPSVSKEADVYAYAMTVLEVFTGKVPYEGISSEQRILILVALQNKTPHRPETNMSDDLWGLLQLCWNRNPSKRPNIAGVRGCLRTLSWFPSDPQLTKDTAPDHTRPKPAGSVEGPKQVGGSATRIGVNPVITRGPSRIGEGPSRSVPPIIVDRPPPPIPDGFYSPRNVTDTTSKSGPYNYATATPVTPINEQPTTSMPSPELWNDSGSPRRRANAEDAATSAHARALEQARKLAAGEESDEEEEEETQRYVRSKFGDQSGRTNSDEEEESEDEETSKEETESSSEETESSVSDRQQRHPPPRPDLYYPDRDRDNQSETTSVPAIAVNSPSNDSNGSLVVTRITDGDGVDKPSEFRGKSLENEPLNYDEFPDLNSPNHNGPPSPSAGNYNGFPVPNDHVLNSRWSRSPGLGLQPPSLPAFTGFDGELDSLKYEPTNNIPTRSNPSRTSGRGSSNGFGRPGTAQPTPPPIIVTPESSSQPSTQRAANSSLAPPPAADKSPGASHPVPGSDFAPRMGAGLRGAPPELGWDLGRSSSSVPAPTLAARPYSQHPGAKEREAEKSRQRDVEKAQQRELERAREQELEKAKERERRREERQREKTKLQQLYQASLTVPVVPKPSPPEDQEKSATEKERQERTEREHEIERTKEREAEMTRQRELEEIRRREFEKARRREVEKARERERRWTEREREKAGRRQRSHQPAPAAVPIVRKPSPQPRLSRGASPAKRMGPSPGRENRQAAPSVPPIVPPPPRIVPPPARIVEAPAKTVEGPPKPWSNIAATPTIPNTSQTRGRDEMRSKKTTPMIKIKSTQQQPSSVSAFARAPPPVVPVARAPSRTSSQALAHPAPQTPGRAPTPSSSRPEINRVRNTLGPTPQVSMAGVGASRRPDIISNQPPPQPPKKSPSTRPNSRFTDRNSNETRTQREAFQVLREQRDHERRRQWDTGHENQGAEENQPPSPQESDWSTRASVAQSEAASTSDEDD